MVESSKRILVSWYTKPSYIPPFRLSSHQFTVGPQIGNDNVAYYDAITPLGKYDLKDVLTAQGVDFAPEAIVVWSDASQTNLPMGLEKYKCPKILCIGDTHHLGNPLQKMIKYSLDGGFDFILSSHNRHHLHWFQEAGHNNVAWIPGLKVQHIPFPIAADREQSVAFFGSTGKYHPRRRYLLKHMIKNKVPVSVKSGSREYSAEIFSRSTLSFNASLNGDLNLRVFEVLSAGGCLLTDRLSPESGVFDILQEDRDIICYDNAEELVEKAKFYLLHPSAALKIAREGHQKYIKNFHPSRQAKVLLDWVFKGNLDALYKHDLFPYRISSATSSKFLESRVRIYENVQDRHKMKEQIFALFTPDVPDVYAADIIDLARMNIYCIDKRDSEGMVGKLPPLNGKIKYISWENAKKLEWDYFFRREAMQNLEININYKTLVIV